jgi:asparagine synthase (glutamine-hydrolysing)
MVLIAPLSSDEYRSPGVRTAIPRDDRYRTSAAFSSGRVMCGIAGYLLRADARVAPERTLRGLLGGLRSRGPDDEGVCLVHRSERRIVPCRSERTVPAVAHRLPDFRSAAEHEPHDAALVNTRFAIVDPSAGGHQPFLSSDGSVAAVFHGEIYNYLELRSELADRGVVFRTKSDTEVLVEGYRRWRDELWERLNGFWAVALFDGADGSVVLSRDRFGVAPLYYREGAGGLYFASLIQPLLEVEATPAPIDLDVARGFIDSGLKDHDEATFYVPIRSLAPACAVRIPAGSSSMSDARATVFWTYPERAATVEDLPFRKAVLGFRSLFMDAVAVRLRADVRLACELSGGLDSSSIVAAAALQSSAVTTYTLRVPEHDEEPYARAMLRSFSLDFRVVEHPESEFLAEASDFLGVMEEPFHAPNVYTHYQLRRSMKQDGVHVVLAGSGGDEALAGYESEFWPRARAELVRERRRLQAIGYDLRLGLRSRGGSRAAALRLFDHSRARPPRALDPAATGSSAAQNRAARLAAGYSDLDFHEQRLYHFRVGLLPYYLRSDDHFSMQLPLEQRSPFLDYRIVDFALRLPAAYLFRRGWTKYILRKAMQPFLPSEIVWRKEKMGFPFPLRSFLERHRAQLEPAIAPLLDHGIIAERIDYGAMLQRSPNRLWRICATGLWLDHPQPRNSSAARPNVIARSPRSIASTTTRS